MYNYTTLTLNILMFEYGEIFNRLPSVQNFVVTPLAWTKPYCIGLSRKLHSSATSAYQDIVVKTSGSMGS